MLSKVVVCLSIVVAVGYAKTITFKDCGSVSGTFSSVDVDPCETDPCVLKKGTNYTITVPFTASVNSASAKTSVHGIIGGVPVPFPVPSDCCNFHNLKCPIVAGQADTYTNNVFCSPQYPSIRLVVKWEVKDENGKDIICFEAPLQIA